MLFISIDKFLISHERKRISHSEELDLQDLMTHSKNVKWKGIQIYLQSLEFLGYNAAVTS